MHVEKPDWLVPMEGILETLNEGVLIGDDCERYIFANQCFTQMSGYPLAEVLGREARHFYPAEDHATLRRFIEKGLQEGQQRFEFYLPCKDGRRLPITVGSRVMEDLEGRTWSILTVTDITEQKLTQQRLKEANALLEERHEEIQRELKLAERVQQSIAPQSLQWGDVRVETLYQPVQTIGGDFGMVAPFGESDLNLLVCDVSGHGISSALIANRIYTEINSLLERRAEFGPLLQRLNSLVLQQISVTGFYFSLAVARLTDGGHRMSFANAGHPPAIVVSPAGQCRLLESRSMVLGLVEESVAVASDPVQDVNLAAGDRVVLYTDGLTEVFDERDELLGTEGLQEIVAQAARLPLPQMKQRIVEKVEAWRHGPVTDDMSLVLVEVQ